MKRALVLINDRVLGNCVVASLVRKQSKLAVETPRSVTTAKQWVKDQADFDLAVVHADLVLEDNDLVTRAGSGLDFVAWFLRNHAKIPTIIIGTVCSERIKGLLDARANLSFVAQGARLAEDLSRALVESEATTHGQYLTLRLFVNDANQWSWSLAGEAYNVKGQGPLLVNQRTVRKLVSDSTKLFQSMAAEAEKPSKKKRNWRREINGLGVKIFEGIFEADRDFSKKFDRAIAKVEDDYKKLKICLHGGRFIQDTRDRVPCFQGRGEQPVDVTRADLPADGARHGAEQSASVRMRGRRRSQTDQLPVH